MGRRMAHPATASANADKVMMIVLNMPTSSVRFVRAGSCGRQDREGMFSHCTGREGGSPRCDFLGAALLDWGDGADQRSGCERIMAIAWFYCLRLAIAVLGRDK